MDNKVNILIIDNNQEFHNSFEEHIKTAVQKGKFENKEITIQKTIKSFDFFSNYFDKGTIDNIPNIIILGVNFNGEELNGVDIAHQIRSKDEFKNTKILFYFENYNELFKGLYEKAIDSNGLSKSKYRIKKLGDGAMSKSEYQNFLIPILTDYLIVGKKYWHQKTHNLLKILIVDDILEFHTSVERLVRRAASAGMFGEKEILFLKGATSPRSLFHNLNEDLPNTVPDILILDFDLKDEEMDGIDVARDIRNNDEFRDIKILFFSGNYDEPYYAHNAKKIGDGAIKKSERNNVLVLALIQLIEGRNYWSNYMGDYDFNTFRSILTTDQQYKILFHYLCGRSPIETAEVLSNESYNQRLIDKSLNKHLESYKKSHGIMDINGLKEWFLKENSDEDLYQTLSDKNLIMLEDEKMRKQDIVDDYLSSNLHLYRNCRNKNELKNYLLKKYPDKDIYQIVIEKRADTINSTKGTIRNTWILQDSPGTSEMEPEEMEAIFNNPIKLFFHLLTIHDNIILDIAKELNYKGIRLMK